MAQNLTTVPAISPDRSESTAPAEPLWRDVLGRQLRRLRHDRQLTLTETAATAGISPQYLSEIERGLKEPSSEMIAAVAGALGSTLLDLTADVVRELAPAPPLRALRGLGGVGGAAPSALALAA